MSRVERVAAHVGQIHALLQCIINECDAAQMEVFDYLNMSDAANKQSEKLKTENAKLREYVTKLEKANLDVTARLTDYIGQYDPTDAFVAEVKAQNAKLRGDAERMFNANVEKNGEITRLLDENAKLRELIFDMLVDEERGHNDDDTFYEHVSLAKELGIEVES